MEVCVMIASYILALALEVRDLFNGALNLVFVVLGGLVLWSVIVISRFVINGCSLRSRARRR